MRKSAAFFFLAVLGLSVRFRDPALAGPCTEDKEKLCSQAKGKGQEAMRSCMEAKKDRLSAGCRKKIESMGRGKEAQGPCAEDKEKFCSQAKGKDQEAMRSCMETHKDRLSAGCRRKIESMAQGKEGRGPCAEDKEKFCSQAKGKGKKAMRSCMEANKDRLSEGCRKVLEKN